MQHISKKQCEVYFKNYYRNIVQLMCIKGLQQRSHTQSHILETVKQLNIETKKSSNEFV